MRNFDVLDHNFEHNYDLIQYLDSNHFDIIKRSYVLLWFLSIQM